MGIELKGWYILAKEGEPSFCFTASPRVCNPWDLIVVIPWGLSNVLSGSPVVYSVFVDLARYTAERRNYYWQHERQTSQDTSIILAMGVIPYPAKSAQIADRPVWDAGGNFGRLARYGIMEEYVQQTMETELRGVPARQWLRFFKTYARES
ncbi:MAG: hypothetical protein JO071_07080 [Deltaproteobacteria bacterium]|nr:hypothetical protein [Deltaproteobacteria bacterium]